MPNTLIERILRTATVAAVCFPTTVTAQHSVAREWNEALLQAIRTDFARPTVHARNLFHSSIAMYDAWAAYDAVASTFILGQEVGGFHCAFDGVDPPADPRVAREEALSYAVYRLLSHRFANSPGADEALPRFEDLFDSFGYDAADTSTDYASGSPPALGNYIAQCVIEFGFQDGANEQNAYANRHYQPTNPPLAPPLPGNAKVVDPNRWQPLILEAFVGQSGVPSGRQPEFLSPEWGQVIPFALSPEDLTIHKRNTQDYWVYHDPGPPPYIDIRGDGVHEEDYRWGHTLVAIWSSHLDPADGVMIDISPASLGNIDSADFPRTLEGLREFYDTFEGGNPGTGRNLNPHTGLPYEPNIVPRGDYTRVIAEFWADGPESETPPGHWFTILNYVSDHPDFEKRFRGQGPLRDDLEWDVKAYFALGGAMHDAAVSAWSIKGWYDYVRPMSAVRWMADQGQSSDPDLPSYSPNGLPLIPGLIEVIERGDPLAEDDPLFFLGKIKLYGWLGPFFIADPDTDAAGVGWMLAGDWWPYQRPTFVTPPFAGYVSGHSTFSRAAAELMTLLTGNEFFPGGVGEFIAPRNEYLAFEKGPSVDVTLQWATYRDASDQTSLSRIWGGIHPPIDDIPARLIGERVGIDAFLHAERYFKGTQPRVPDAFALFQNFPNPFNTETVIRFDLERSGEVELSVYNLTGQRALTLTSGSRAAGTYTLRWDGRDRDGRTLASGIYLYRLRAGEQVQTRKLLLLR